MKIYETRECFLERERESGFCIPKLTWWMKISMETILEKLHLDSIKTDNKFYPNQFIALTLLTRS